MKKFAILAVLMSVSGAEAARWNKGNNPDVFNLVSKTKMIYAFHELPLMAAIKDDRFGWSETYWPSNKGGIAYRWNSRDPMPFKYKLYTKEELKEMSLSQLDELSPAELYDISQGDYSYKLTRKVLKEYKPTNLWWEGICHGWSLSAINYAEPGKVIITNKDGIKVPFGSSDVKGLISMHDAYNSKGVYVRVGDRCKAKGKVPGEAVEGKDIHVNPPSVSEANTPECSDVNAGAFHIVLTNMIGINSHGFVADVDRFNDVWNQPVTSYESQIVGEVTLSTAEMSRGVDRKIRLKTVMHFGEELKLWTPELEAKGIITFVSKEPVTGTPHQVFEKRHYDYVLELDKMGNIIGGEWISESRPDMLWLKARDPKFLNGKFPLSGLNEIYKPAER